MGPFFLHEANGYAAWAAGNDGGSPYRSAASVDELRHSGAYRILTPDSYVAELKAAPFAFAYPHPFCGGITPELAWSSLRLFQYQVMPAFV